MTLYSWNLMERIYSTWPLTSLSVPSFIFHVQEESLPCPMRTPITSKELKSYVTHVKYWYEKLAPCCTVRVLAKRRGQDNTFICPFWQEKGEVIKLVSTKSRQIKFRSAFFSCSRYVTYYQHAPFHSHDRSPHWLSYWSQIFRYHIILHGGSGTRLNVARERRLEFGRKKIA